MCILAAINADLKRQIDDRNHDATTISSTEATTPSTKHEEPSTEPTTSTTTTTTTAKPLETTTPNPVKDEPNPVGPNSHGRRRRCA